MNKNIKDNFDPSSEEQRKIFRKYGLPKYYNDNYDSDQPKHYLEPSEILDIFESTFSDKVKK